MTDTELLKKEIKKSGIKMETIMKAAGIKSYATLRGRINNETEFTASEISAISELLRFSAETRDKVFFTIKAE